MIGSSINQYKIQEKIGQGGMGSVYKAWDNKLKRTVAIKFLLPELCEKAGSRKRFVNEARALSKLNHPNICTLHDADKTADGRFFFVLAYCEGDTLWERIRREPLPIETILDFSIQIAQGLADAHFQEIVHRDIKTANIIIVKNEIVKIVDFGLAKMTELSLHTKAGAIFGTSNYMSPEQVRGEELDFRTDIWSFGVTIYEMLTGKMLFQGENQQAIWYAITNKPVPLITAACPDTPAELAGIINRALAKQREERFESMDDMLGELKQARRQYLLGESLSAVVSSPKTFRSKRKPVFVTALIISILVIMSAAYLLLTNKPVPIQIAVADFDNKTADRELDGLSEMLITALEQSQRLSVLTRSRMFDILKQIPGSAEIDIDNFKPIDAALTKKICRYSNIAAMAVTSIRRFENTYAIDINVIDPVVDSLLFAASERDEGKASIPAMIDRLSQQTHEKFNIENLNSGKRVKGVETVITTNLEAFAHFSRARDYWYKLQDEKAKEELKQAIAIDPEFALAHALLAYIYIGTPDEKLARAPVNKAMNYLHRTPEKEKYLVLAINANFENGPEAAVAVMQEMKKLYPGEKDVYLGLGYFSLRAGNIIVAQKNARKALKLDPTSDRAREILAKIQQTMSAAK